MPESLSGCGAFAAQRPQHICRESKGTRLALRNDGRLQKRSGRLPIATVEVADHREIRIHGRPQLTTTVQIFYLGIHPKNGESNGKENGK